MVSNEQISSAGSLGAIDAIFVAGNSTAGIPAPTIVDWFKFPVNCTRPCSIQESEGVDP
jgi:hypothetical protein